MKILNKSIERKNDSGWVKVIPEHTEDLWHLYNIIGKGDRIGSSTVRRVTKETSLGSTSDRMRMFLTIEVENIEFDPTGGIIRLSGKNVTESKWIKIGQYHTIEVEPNKGPVQISKAKWDIIHLKRLEDAADITKSADVAAVILQEGIAQIILVTEHMSVTKQKIEVSIPKKRYTATAHEKAMDKFFDAILRGMIQHINFDVVKCVIIASPGFLREELVNYINKVGSQKDEYKVLLQNREKYLVVHSSSGHKQALKEILSDPNTLKRLENTKAIAEVRAMKEFYDTLNVNPNKAVYGLPHVLKAAESQAIQTLLVTDSLFRSDKLKEREQYVELVENVKEKGGEVIIFSSMHVSGEQLAKLSGVAAILRFPLDFDDEIDTEESDSDDESSDEEEKKEVLKDEDIFFE